MIFLLNLLFGILAFFATRYVLLSLKAAMEIATIVGIIVGLIIFFCNFGAQVV